MKKENFKRRACRRVRRSVLRLGRSALSVLLCLAMLLTTFCFFDIGSLVSEAKIETAANENPSVYFYVPEAIYLAPKINSLTSANTYNFQWFIQNTVETSDTSKEPTVKTGYDTSGYVYFSYANLSGNVTLSAKFLSSTMGALSGGSITDVTMSDDGKYKKATIKQGSTSPSLAASATGCYIEWTASYKDSVDGYQKTVTAYTYVYKPYIQPFGVALKTINNRGDNSYGDNISWISGVHGYSETGGRIPRAETNGSGLVTFSSTNNTNVTAGSYNTTQVYVQFSDYWRRTADNNWSGDWLTDSNSNFSTKTFNMSEVDDGHNYGNTSLLHFAVSPKAKMTVDISRYTNFSQIPNLTVGMMVTNDKDTKRSGAWYVADAGNDTTGRTTNIQRNGTGTAESYWNSNRVNIMASVGNYNSLVSDAEVEGVKYNGTWIKNTSGMSENSTCTVKTGYFNHDSDKTGSNNNYGGDTIWNISRMSVDVHALNKSSLRSAVRNAQMNFAKLGIYNSSTMSSYYYSGTAYNTFVNNYKAACAALTKVDGTYGSYSSQSDINTLATALNNSLAAATGTAREYNLGLERLNDGQYRIVKLGDTAQYSKTYNARDNVSFTPDTFTGYTYAGKIELTNETIDVDSYNEKTLASLPTFFSASNLYSSTMSISGTTATISETTTKTTTVPKFDGNKTTYEWVAAAKDTSLTIVNFYIANQYTLNFDGNGGTPTTSVTVTYGSANYYDVSWLSTSRSGYTFAGWYTAAEGGTQVYGADGICIPGTKYWDSLKNWCYDGDLTVYAHWTPYFDLNWYFNDSFTGTGDLSKAKATVYINGTAAATNVNDFWRPVTPGSTVKVVVTAGSNWHLSDPSSGTYEITMPSTTTSFAPKLYSKYKVVFNGNGNTGGSTATQDFIWGTAKTLNANGFTKTGYNFAGWATSADGVVVYADKASVNKLTDTAGGTVNLYAKWNAKDITLHYNGNNNTGGTIPGDSTFKYASSVTTAAAPTRGYTVSYNANDGSVSTTSANTAANYTFSGWLSNKNSKSYSAATAYSDSFGATEGTVTLTAQWTGGTVTLPTPTRNGYTFGGWYTNSALTSSAGAAGAKYTATSNITLYAKWTPNNYTVTFNKQSGTGGTDSVTATYDSAMPTITVPTRAGYTFGGYFTGTNGSGTQYYYANGTSARTWNIADNTTLYAKWTANTNTVYKVNVYVMDKSGAYPATPTTHSYTGITDTSVTINEATWAKYYPDKSGQFSLDNSKSNTLTGTINGNGSLVLVVYIKRASHTVYYNAQTNGGQTTTQSRTVYYQGAVDFSLTASKTDWTFVGWNTTSTATTKQTSLTMGTTDITLYAIFSCTPKAKFYYLDGTTQKYVEVSATIYNTATSAAFAVPNISASCNLNDLDWQQKGFTSNTSYAAGTTSGSMTYTSSSITASSDIKYYMNYSATVKLTHNGNNGTLTGSDPTGTSYLNASSVNTQTAVSLKTQTPAVRDGYVFLGWSEISSATSASYAAEETISLKANKTLYAIWFDLKEAESKSDTYDSGYKDKQVTTPIVKGVKVKADGEFETLTDGVVTTFNAVQYEAYKNAVEAYNKAKEAFVANKTTANNATLLEKANALIKTALPTMNDLVDKYFKDADEAKSGNFVIEYDDGVTEKPIEAGQHSLKEMNLNHYKTEVLNNALSAKNSGADCKTVLQQATLNTAVENMAKAFVSVGNVTTTPAYKVYENAAAAASIKDADDNTLAGTTAVNYVYAGKGNYTYYCYTNSTNPTVLITVDDIASAGRVCYPTTAMATADPVLSESTEKAIAAKKEKNQDADVSMYSTVNVSADNVDSNYDIYTKAGIGGNISYYQQKQVIKLTPLFTSGENGTVTYEFTAHDDALSENVATMSALTAGIGDANNWQSNLTDDKTYEKKITIIINYHSGEKMNVTAEQVDPDVCLKQYHLFRTAGGATNWELPKKTGEKYSVNDPVYGQTDTGSFTYTFTLGSANDETAAVIKDTNDYISSTSLGFVINPTTTVDTTGVHISSDKNFTTLAESKMTEKQKALRTVQQALKGKFSTAKVFSGTISGGDGLGLWEWGNNWSYNYYPKSEAYTYVHIIDRWGNVYEDIFWVGKQDAKPVSSNPNSSSAGAYEILEAGGSGIDTLSLNAASMEILTDESSTLENNVYKTTGNTVKIQTGEANKSYTLTMKDKATNSSTATLTSDENGIITLNVTDEAYTSGVYTFMLNDIEINLYDTVNNDIYIVKVNDGEAEEGDYAELSVVTTGEVGKVRFTDTDGNTITIASCEKNADGTKTWKMSKKRAAGEYKYSISVKVGYNWIEESSKGTLTFTAKILDSGVIRSAEYDTETGLYKITIEGRATKIQFITEDGMTRTYTRYNEFVKSKKTYDAEGNEVNDTARTLDHEIWLVDAKLYSGLKYTVAGKFEAGWNMNGTATMTAH